MTGSSSPASGSPIRVTISPATAATSGLADSRPAAMVSSPAAFSAMVRRVPSDSAALAAVSTDCGRPTSSPHSSSEKPKPVYAGCSITATPLPPCSVWSTPGPAPVPGSG